MEGAFRMPLAWAPRLGWTALAAVSLWAALAVYLKTHGHLESALHGAGWLVKVKLSNPAELNSLMDAAAYEAFIEEKKKEASA